jgi:hypothetical protein
LAASFGSIAAWTVFAIGLVLRSFGLVIAGIALLSAVVLFKLINLPDEFDARARWVLPAPGQIHLEEDEVMARVQYALAWTYVTNRPTGMLTLLYLLFRPGLLGGRRHESDRPRWCGGDRRIRGRSLRVRDSVFSGCILVRPNHQAVEQDPIQVAAL